MCGLLVGAGKKSWKNVKSFILCLAGGLTGAHEGAEADADSRQSWAPPGVFWSSDKYCAPTIRNYMQTKKPWA
jgi:hypothetical protein